MPIDMKASICRCASTLLTKKHTKKLTVKDIVEECGITRQTFYYHFQDIPDMICYMLEQSSKELLQNCTALPDMESKIRYLLNIALNARPLVEHTISASYHSELEPLLLNQFCSFFEQLFEKSTVVSTSVNLTKAQQKLLIRYHSLAFLGLIRTWSTEDTARMDEIVHDLAIVFKSASL